ncbi:16S rRNA (guanine966-N2)-methyltransferase [Azospirillum fermentarium]|uniref:RsmD family RNA methyltransferase n=1 Tax=Azospirillum fermentarium TaxID=1233114 RepID=UPI0022279908|nr:RsmD family RNA methyltransferase [Azospirillum fermentarium]MCW2244433.1 16S rRNA (guanine966-N2)-methyltransferase [Azospirillum fermentarium]
MVRGVVVAVRIVGGKHRGRTLSAPSGRDVRPTSDRTREALFNILAHCGWGPDGESPIGGAVVLDAFCGTGALALEALSRGAARAVMLDMGRGPLDCARANAAALGESASTLILRGDATKPPPPKEPATLAFLDPPYGRGLGEKALAALAAGGWFAPRAVVMLEETASVTPILPDGFAPLDERLYGDTRVTFLRWG